MKMNSNKQNTKQSFSSSNRKVVAAAEHSTVFAGETERKVIALENELKSKNQHIDKIMAELILLRKEKWD
jgi:hypothetical protein